MQQFYSNGKLLLSGEYAVIDGAIALAVPTKFGQFLEVELSDSATICWKSINYKGELWYDNEFEVLNEKITTKKSDPVSERLLEIFGALQHLKPKLFNTGAQFISTLNFDQNWGLGSSSTLINNLAQWANVDPFQLLELTFGGSGFDIACAQNNSPLLYQRVEGKPMISPVRFDPPFKDKIFFVYRNQKQNSRSGIKNYKDHNTDQKLEFSALNSISNQLLSCKTLHEFEQLVTQHEILISKLIHQSPLKKELFEDYPGAIKSLGAWGGDFFLATGNVVDQAYFITKGYSTILPFKDMVL